MNTLTLRKQASKLVLAVALATGTAMVAGHIVPDEAQAQRAKKKKKKKDKAPEQDYSNEWRAVFVPLDEQMRTEGVDVAALQPQIAQVLALTKSADEKLQTGQLVYNAGLKTNNLEQRLQGMELMLESNKLPFNVIPEYNFIAFQTARNLEDYDKAFKYLETATGLGYTNSSVGRADLMIYKANLYFDQDKVAEGLTVLDEAIEAKQATGTPAPVDWYTFGFSKAYNYELEPQVYEWAQARAAAYPTQANWLDAINVVRQLKEFEDDQELDLLRLVRKVGAMTKQNEFRAFIDAARDVLTPYPKEVKELIEEGYASGTLERNDSFIGEVYAAVSRRVVSDQAELPEYAAEARADDASLGIVTSSADTFLSYEDYATAIELYEKALTMPGVNADEVNMHLGMAQIGSGDFEAAKATFAKVTGEGQPIANLWTAYAVQESGGPVTADAPADDGPSLSELMGASS